MTQKHYLLGISIGVTPGPPMIFRVPWPMPRWRSILRATTAVMRSHGLRQKDLLLDGLVEYPQDRTDESRVFADRVDRGYVGAKGVVSQFWLYDWRRGAFKLARAALEAA